MRKTIVAINITLDGFCDHTAVIADEELHEFFANVMEKVGTSVMGRITYQLMEDYWPEVAKNKSGTGAEVKFAEAIDKVEKIVVSRTLTSVNWENTTILSENIVEKIKQLKLEEGGNIDIGGPSLISLLAQENLIDEFIFVIHPFILGKGIALMRDLPKRLDLELIDERRFKSGAIVTHYKKRHNSYE